MKRYGAKPSLSGAKAALLEVALEDTVAHDRGVSANAVNTTRKMYRDPATFRSPMFDRRVVRGSTVFRRVESMAGETRTAREIQARKKVLARKLEAERKNRDVMLRARLGCEPPVVTKREPEPVELCKHLEEIVDREPEVETVEMMTDQFLERPETPPYVPAKTGLEASTQIEPLDLWDYDLEVWPILEVLVGKTIEQALFEVVEEEELADLQAHQRKYMEMRLSEEAEKLRLIEQEVRLREEKERRIREYHIAVALQKETEERIAAAVFAHGYIADLLPNVLEGLKMAGYLLDDIREFVEMDFLPGLGHDVDDTLRRRTTVHDILTTIVREIQETNAAVYARLGEESPPPPPFVPREVSSQLEVDRKPSLSYPTEILVMGTEDYPAPTEMEPEPVKGKRIVPIIPEGGYKRFALPPTPAAVVEEAGQSPHDSKTGSPHDSNTGSPHGSNTGSPHGSKTGSPHGSNTGSPHGSKTGSPHGSKTGSLQGSKTGSPQGSKTDALRLPRGSV